jgi:hypothetical protein
LDGYLIYREQGSLLQKSGRPHGLLRGGFVLIRAFGFIGACGAACTAWCALSAPVGQSKADEQHDQKYNWNDEVFHNIMLVRPVVVMDSL